MLNQDRGGRHLAALSLSVRVRDIPPIRDQSVKPTAKTKRGLDREVAQVMKREKRRVFFMPLPGGRAVSSKASKHNGSVTALRELNLEFCRLFLHRFRFYFSLHRAQQQRLNCSAALAAV